MKLLLLAAFCAIASDPTSAQAPDVTDSPISSTPAIAITVPKDDYSVPDHLYVLPVFLVPSDKTHLAEDPDASGKDLDGKSMNSNRLVEFVEGRQNLSAHLHMARRKYESMLKNPLNGASRGTFKLASWSHVSSAAVPVNSSAQLVNPVIVRSTMGVDTIASAYASKNYGFLAQVLNRVGCRQSTCPFVFMVVVMGDPIDPAGGQRFNHGYNNGGGWLVLNFLGHIVKASAPASQVTLLSTLLHELGHAFGMPHIDDYCQVSDALTCLLRLSKDGSKSIMSYNKKNQIYGCGFTTASASNPGNWQGPCVYPGHAKVDAFPGALVAEDLRVVGMNHRAFSALHYEEGLDAPNTTVYRLNGIGKTSIAGHGTIELTSSDTHPGFSTPPSVLIGADDSPFAQFQDAIDAGHVWHSRQVGPQGWVTVSIRLPASVLLNRIDAYSGFANGTHPLTGISVYSKGALGAQLLNTTANQSIIFNVTTDRLDVQLRASKSGHDVLRGLRIWGVVGGKTTELYPAAEPKVIDVTAGTLTGTIQSTVGSTQAVLAYTQAHLYSVGWHSAKIQSGSWMSMTVQFPQEVRLGSIKMHTGHSAKYHAARQLQIERRCICGTTDPAGCAANNATCTSEGAGGFVFEFVRRVNSSPDELVGFTPGSAKVWKIAMRIPTPVEQLQNPGYIYLRGVRFFTIDGAELFPARLVAEGI